MKYTLFLSFLVHNNHFKNKDLPGTNIFTALLERVKCTKQCELVGEPNDQYIKNNNNKGCIDITVNNLISVTQ